jgi:ribosome-associated protein YbcJ (S4-like RNA binding protein)
MSVALKIVDQTLGIHPPVIRELRLVSERITLRELLKRRIDEEVAGLNAGGGDEIKPLVAPMEQEVRLNGEKPTRRMVDPERQLAAAVEAFERRRIVIIVDGRQVLDLDQAIVVVPDTEVRFLKLVPLVGG